MEDKGFCELGFAKVDTDRMRRRGFPEVIYCTGKTREEIKLIARQIIRNNQILLLTKLSRETFVYLKKTYPKLRYNQKARIGYIPRGRVAKKGTVGILSAGTSDIPVAEEAAVTLEVMGNKVARLYDVGCAGVHRLMKNKDMLAGFRVIVVVAGMEGALASVVSGLVAVPVIAVPTSCGYGANFSGLSALLTMLNSCSPGIGVVNIDNGFGAGYLASLINK